MRIRPRDVPAAEAEGAEDADLARARVDRAHHRHEDDQGLDRDDHGGDEVAEGAELVEGVHAVLDHLLHERVTLVPGQTPRRAGAAISSTGQSLHSAATCTMETMPGLSSTLLRRRRGR